MFACQPKLGVPHCRAKFTNLNYFNYMWKICLIHNHSQPPRAFPPGVRNKVVAAEESEEESPNDEAALSAPLQSQESMCSLSVSCGCENEPGPV